MKTKITHITSAHQRYDTRIFLKECVSIASQKDFFISLIVADGKGDEVMKNVSIVDVGKPTGRINRMLVTTKKILQKAIELDSDIYHFHDPELIPVGLKLKKLGKRVIYDIHELTSQQILHREWIPFPLRLIISKTFNYYEENACKQFDYLLVPQPLMIDMYNQFTNTDSICNFVSSKYFKQRTPNNNDNGTIVAMHAGSLTDSRGLDNMLNTFNNIKNAKLLLAGPITLDNLKKVEQTKNTLYKGMLSVEEVNGLYDESDIGIILYNNVGQYYLAFSIKLFEYMLKGMPIIMPNFGEWVGFNETYKCGINVDVTNPIDVQNAISKLANDKDLYKKLSENGMLAAKENFTWESQEKKLIQIYKELWND